MIDVEKIKINMVSGASLEKPLVSAFKSNNAIYVVFDNEINGTMGLPIILVSKLENNKLVKIIDQNEWGVVKETLRMIIAGNQVDYVVVGESLSADDVFFSQLTLPVASFDALKNNYRPNVEDAGSVVNNVAVDQDANVETPVENVVPVEDSSQPESVGESIPVAQNEQMVESAPVDAQPVEMPQVPQMDIQQSVDVPIAPLPQEESVVSSDVTPVMPDAPVDAQTVAPVSETTANESIPEIEVPVENQSVVSDAPAENVVAPVDEVVFNNAEDADVIQSQNDVPVDFTADKEAFLKACENMFDALLAKFKK